MQMESGRNNRRKPNARPYTSIGVNPTKDERIKLYEVFKREERNDDI